MPDLQDVVVETVDTIIIVVPTFVQIILKSLLKVIYCATRYHMLYKLI